jgi:hypothetical protein
VSTDLTTRGFQLMLPALIWSGISGGTSVIVGDELIVQCRHDTSIGKEASPLWNRQKSRGLIH